jgi:hypothetical protein
MLDNRIAPPRIAAAPNNKADDIANPIPGASLCGLTFT